jgi:methionine-rich copper-binding protein CopC
VCSEARLKKSTDRLNVYSQFNFIHFFTQHSKDSQVKNLIKISASLALVALASSAFAHAKLQNSTPADGSTVSPAPTELSFTYNEPIEPAMSSFKLLGPDGKLVATQKVEISKDDDKVLLIKELKLTAGTYRAEWSTMGHDGHHIKGTVKFTVK